MTKLFLWLTLCSPILTLAFPSFSPLGSRFREWSAPRFSLKDLGLPENQERLPVLVVGNEPLGPQAPPIQHAPIWTFWIGAAIAVAFLRTLFGLRGVIRLIRSAYPIRTLGGTKLLASDAVTIPFSFWLPGSAYVVIPSMLLLNRDEFRISVLHELQHHRQGDTRWAHLLSLMKVLLSLNPLAHFWESRIAALQEFACDERLLQRGRAIPLQYARSLMAAAERGAGLDRSPPALSRGMAARPSGALLRSRVLRVLQHRRRRIRHRLVELVAMLGLLVFVASVYCSHGLIHDRRISMEQARALAERASVGTTFPITMNTTVLRVLNELIGTPEARAYLRGAIARMKPYRAMLERKLRQYSLPQDLIAIGIVESGYRNIARHAGREAGVWMWTADPKYLRTDLQVDERLDPEASTDATCRYLRDSYSRFGDWYLATLDNNAGHWAVENGIRKTGSRDVWKLLAQGHENDHDYVPMVVAAALILKYPWLLN